MRFTTGIVFFSAALLFSWGASAEIAVFTGSRDAQPIIAGFARDRVVQSEDGFQLQNGNDPYRSLATTS